MSDKNTFTTEYDTNIIENPIIAQAVAEKIAAPDTAINFRDGKMVIASGDMVDKMSNMADKFDSLADKVKDDDIANNVKDILSVITTKNEPDSALVAVPTAENQAILNTASFEIPTESPIADVRFTQDADPELVKQQLAAVAELNNLNPTPEQIEQIGQAVDARELTGAAQEAKRVLGEHTQRMLNQAARQTLQRDGRI